MDRNDELYFNQLVKDYNNDMKKITNDCKKLLHEALMETVFSYSPKEYSRTGQLEDMNNIKIEIIGDIAHIYFDTDNMQYYSFGKGKGHDTSGLTPVGAEAVIHFLEVSHDTYAPFDGEPDMFHHYPAQHFLELAKNKIKAKYPDLNVEVIRDQPPIY